MRTCRGIVGALPGLSRLLPRQRRERLILSLLLRDKGRDALANRARFDQIPIASFVIDDRLQPAALAPALDCAGVAGNIMVSEHHADILDRHGEEVSRR